VDFFPRFEEAFNTVWVSDADLDMVLIMEAGAFIDGLPFDEEAADGIEGLFVSGCPL